MTDILDSKGSTSSMRVGMLACVETACLISIAVVVGNILTEQPIDSNIPWIIGGLLSAGFGGKVMQKGKEV